VSEHLGGYIEGGDPATQYPELWTWLVKKQGVQTVLDVGCGEGQAIDYFLSLGADAWGIEGTPQAHHCIDEHDFTYGPYVGALEGDLVWCCEFLEHIEDRYLPNITGALTSAPLVLVTHAFPGQQGHHHVNCRTPEYWVGFFAGLGYSLDEDFTARCRAYAAFNKDPYNHFVRSGLAFRRNDEAN
jgi:SAM-dependent methyltransferase